MENTFYLEIITPDRQFYTGPATNLTMPALDGEYGVQPGHEPVVTALRPGTVRFQTDGTPHEVVVSDGFAEIMPDYCILLVSSADVLTKSTVRVPNAPKSARKNGCARSRVFVNIISPKRLWPVLWHA